MNKPMSFREDGTFTIVQFTDVHWRNGESGDLKSRDLMERVLRAEKPDLVVFTGDIIHGGKCRDPERSLRQAVAAAERSGIPWAAVFGNHDAEAGATRERLMQIMKEHEGCLAEPGPEGVNGVGNYVIRLADRDGRLRAALYFLDSGALSETPGIPGCDWIRRSQIDWYIRESERLAASAGEGFVGAEGVKAGGGVPALAFFHIPLPEYEEVWRTQVCEGRRHERAACARVNSGFFAAMAEQGDVMGTFCGHDHTNDYGGRLLQIRLYYGRASGYHGYGSPFFSRGARVIRLTAGERDFETWVRLHDGRVITRPPIHRPWLFRLRERLRRML